ncbi:hypothetical protein XA68_17092 [Ophiocordyceps unilateralis]|uniref:Uncharacterized protein n=1 Tax=Ophiocordyceps unilateralis TaxID=268505 RepID=A0A2A9PJ51_OPHUN|nr:hypothetical protein XA68_17092 [Ophiocordyceps unilateralis]
MDVLPPLDLLSRLLEATLALRQSCHDGARILQNKQHPRPLRLARIPPYMARRPLNSHVSSFQPRLLTRSQGQDDAPLDDDGIVEVLPAARGAFVLRRKVDDSTDGSAGTCSEGARACIVRVEAEVELVVQSRRRRGRAVDVVYG